MNKTVNINLAGIIFYVDEDAYKHLSQYLASIKAQFSNSEERAEIIADIEARIAELLQEKLSTSKQVVNQQDVDDVISVMGSPEDFSIDEEDPDFEGTKSENNSGKAHYTGPKRLYRNPDDKILSGVSSGIALYFGIDPIWIRLIWIALFFGWGTGFILYIILWIVMPEAKTTAQKLQMRGEPINIDNIEKSVKEEMQNVKERFSNYQNKSNNSSTSGKIRNAIEDVIQAILSVLKYIILFAFKFAGVILMFVGVLALILLLSLFLGSDINFNGNAIDWHNISGYMQALFNSGTHSGLFVTGMVMLALAPVIGIILLSMRILFKYKPDSRYTGLGIGILAALGFVAVFATSMVLVRGFAARATSTKTIELGNPQKTYAMEVTDFLDDEQPYDLDWTITDKYQLLADVQLDVKSTKKAEPYLELVSESKGRNKIEARERATNYEFYTAQKDTILEFADYFLVPENEKYRNQELQATLYLPVGYKIYLDQSLEDLVYDIKNVTNTYDRDMLNHWWVMTQNGLACMDCNTKTQKWRDDEEWESYEDQFEAEAQETERKYELEEAQRKLEEAQAELERLQKKEK